MVVNYFLVISFHYHHCEGNMQTYLVTSENMTIQHMETKLLPNSLKK